MVHCVARPSRRMAKGDREHRRRDPQPSHILHTACDPERLSEGLRPSSDALHRVSCVAQVVEQLSNLAQARHQGRGHHRRWKASRETVNAAWRTRLREPPVSREQAHARRPIVLAGVQSCSTSYPDRFDAPEALHRAHTGAQTAPIDDPSFSCRVCSLTLSDALPAARELTREKLPRPQADGVAHPFQLVALTCLRPRAELACVCCALGSNTIDEHDISLVTASQWSRLAASRVHPVPALLTCWTCINRTAAGSTTAQWRRQRCELAGH